MRAPKNTTPVLFLSRTTVVALILLLILSSPFWLFIVLYSVVSLPSDIPFGVSGQRSLTRNFHARRPALEAVVTTVRVEGLSDVERGYWSLTGYKLPEPQSAAYENLYEVMRQARVQQVHVVEREPLVIELITDERTAMIDTNRYGYMYLGDRYDRIGYGKYSPRLAAHWYVFEEIP